MTDRRWDADFLTLSELIKKGTLGRIVEFETHFDRYRPEILPGGWKTKPSPGGGAVYDLGTHLIDQVVATFGLPKKITGFIGTQRENNTNGLEDSCTVLLHYDGMLSTVKAAVVSPEVNQLRYWVRGVKGSYKKVLLLSIWWKIETDIYASSFIWTAKKITSRRERILMIPISGWRHQTNTVY